MNISDYSNDIIKKIEKTNKSDAHDIVDLTIKIMLYIIIILLS